MEKETHGKRVLLRTAAIVIAALLACAVYLSACDKPTITLSASEAQTYVGRTLTLTATTTARKVDWSSSDPSIAMVDDGVVTGVGEGITVITASIGTAMASCVVTVSLLPSSGKGAYPELIWEDEFDGTTLNASNWSYMTGIHDDYYGSLGPDRWGNNELQCYTDGDNTDVQNGVLTITARREDRTAPDRNGKEQEMHFTSARICTRDNFSYTFGYIEARIKLPAGKGMWPAFWLLPQPTDHTSSRNIYGGWSASGEIDILEAKGTRPTYVSGAAHYGGNPHRWKSKEYQFTDSTYEEWHTYALEWTADFIKWYVDDSCYNTVTRYDPETKAGDYYSDSSAAEGRVGAPFDQPFFILFNLAVDSGSFDSNAHGGPSDDFTEGVMEIDYVRVYK